MDFPEGIRRMYYGGYECTKCGAYRLNTKFAQQHDCEKYKENHKKRYGNLKSPVGGYGIQANSKKYRK